MARSKFVINGETYLDLTEDTTNASTTLAGYTGHKNDGTPFTGDVQFATYYTGSAEPSASLGVDGDLYLKTTS